MASKCQAVAMNAITFNANDDVAGLESLPYDNLVERHCPNSRPSQIKTIAFSVAFHNVTELRDFTARNRNVRASRPSAQTFSDRLDHVRIELLHSKVINHRDGCRANADQIIHIHGDTINAYRIVLAHHLGDDHLCAHAISRNGKPNAPNIENVSKVANVKSDSAYAITEGPC